VAKNCPVPQEQPVYRKQIIGLRSIGATCNQSAINRSHYVAKKSKDPPVPQEQSVYRTQIIELSSIGATIQPISY
jgi:hypothetical protein